VRSGQTRRLGRGAVALAALLLWPIHAPAAIATPARDPGAPRVAAMSAATFLAEKRAAAESLARRGLPDSKVLPTRPRQQMTDYDCGPAVAQVIINYTRGISSTSIHGARSATNWTTQAVIGRWMGTSIYGTGAKGVTKGLNHRDGVRKPFNAWTYVTDRTGSPKAFHDKVVTDVGIYGMPLAIAINPHMADVGIYHLASWPMERPRARHWITIRGYEGLWGSPYPIVHYSDSSGGYGGGTGNYWDLSLVLHETNARNYGRIVW
jgi:hypothetical protein